MKQIIQLKKQDIMQIFRLISSLVAVVYFINPAYSVDVFPALDQESNQQKMVIYSSLDVNFVENIIKQFQQSVPNIEIEYHDLQTFDIYDKVVTESDNQQVTADFVFSSAMDLQVKLANDGYAKNLPVSIASNLPSYAKWRQMVFGLTNEPAVIVYNKEWFKNKTIPKTHDEVTKFLVQYSQEIFGRVATYDIERSGLGLFFLAQDQKYNINIWPLVSAMGQAGVRLYTNSSAILQRVADGTFILGYNILGSYAETYAKTNPGIGIVMPEDYTIITSRIGLVPRFAAQPLLGESFLQYLASTKGQSLFEEHINTLPRNVANKSTKFQYVRIGPGLVVYQDQLKRQKLVRKWNNSLEPQQ